MAAYEVPKKKWSYKLAPQLTGKAQQAFAAMTLEEASSYDRVKQAIFLRYNIIEETYRHRFRAASRGEGESFRELAVRLFDLAQKWTRECKTVNDVLEMVVVEQLVSTMPEELRIRVHERKPKTSREAGEWADDHEQAKRSAKEGSKSSGKGQGEANNKRCYKCHRLGHLSKDCRAEKDDASKGSGADASGADASGADASGKKSPAGVEHQKTAGGLQNMKCYNCQQKGHLAAKCPNRAMYCEQSLGQAEAQKGEKMECPMVCRGSVEGKQVEDILLDTGCSRTLVKSSLVPKEKLLNEWVEITCAHGNSVKYQLATVSVQIEGESRSIKVGVAGGLPRSMLLGTDSGCLMRLLQNRNREKESCEENTALVVTRSQAKKLEDEEEQEKMKDAASGVEPTPVPDEDQQEVDEEAYPWQDFPEPEEDVIRGVSSRRRLTRREKREERWQFAQGREGGEGHEEWDSTELKRMQEEDESLKELWLTADSEEQDSAQFFVREGLLYRRGKCKGVGEVDQLVLPELCRKVVLTLAHKIPLAGHMGRHKTTNRVLQRFYWPNVRKDVATFCKTCGVCQKARGRKVKPAPLIPLPVISQPFQRVAMDIVGPLVRSCRGHKYILVICDYATRYPEAIPLKTIDAENIAEEFMKFISRVGVPEEVLTDQGTNFMSQLMKELYSLLQVKGIRTSPYHPQTDGLVERFNQTLKAMIRKFVVKEGKDWDKLLPYLLFAYREVPQDSTGFSPFELLYGRAVRGPLDIVKERWEGSKKSTESVLSYIMTVQEELSKMTELVQSNLREAQATQKRWYDAKARSRQFEPGEKVLVLLPTSTNKLLAQWQGPYTIQKRIGDVNYEVDMSDTRKRRRVFHVNMLKQWHDSPAQACFMVSDMSPDADPDDVEALSWSEARKPEAENQPMVNRDLGAKERAELEGLLKEFSAVMSDEPGRTHVAEHRISTGTAKPIRKHPYRIPHAYQEAVQKSWLRWRRKEW